SIKFESNDSYHCIQKTILNEDDSLGYNYQWLLLIQTFFYELHLQNNLQIFMILTNLSQYLNFKC
ncbi:hypothetical protein FWK35_00005376, partial [Aphis craccivora]